MVTLYSVKIFSGYEAFENRPVSTIQEDNGRTTVKLESVWTLSSGRTSVPMNESKSLTHNVTVSPIGVIFVFRRHPHIHRPEGFGRCCLSMSAIMRQLAAGSTRLTRLSPKG
jgi:hypothetical protein